MTKPTILEIHTADLHPISSAEGKRGILLTLHLKPKQQGSLQIALTIEQAEGLMRGIEHLSGQARRSVPGPKGLQ